MAFDQAASILGVILDLPNPLPKNQTAVLKVKKHLAGINKEGEVRNQVMASTRSRDSFA